MSNWNNPTSLTQYLSVISELKQRDEDALKMLDGTTDSNLPVDAKRWNPTNKRFEKWNGTSWEVLVSRYDINVDKLDGYDASNASGGIPINNGSLNINLVAQYLGSSAQNAAFFRNAGNMNAGVLPSARLSGTYSINISGNANSVGGVQLSGLQQVPSAVSGFVGAGYYFVEGDIGATSASFDIDASLASNVWESIGPTGSGADHIFSAMDIIPANAKFVEVRILHRVWDTNGSYIQEFLYARKTGSTADTSSSHISIAVMQDNGADAANEHIHTGQIGTVKIPIDGSRRFDLRHFKDGTGRIALMRLVGFGV